MSETLELNNDRESNKPFEFSSSSGNTVHLRSFVRLNDFEFLLSLCEDEIISDKDFVIKLLDHFLIDMTGKKIAEWGDNELLLLCDKWSLVIFSEIDDIEIKTFSDFRKTANSYANIIKERFTETAQNIQKSIHKSLSSYWAASEVIRQQNAIMSSVARQAVEQVSLFNKISLPAVKFPGILDFSKLLEVSENIFSATKAATAWSDEFSKTIRSMTESFSFAGKHVAAALASTRLSVANLSALGIFENLEARIIRHQEDAAKAFKAAGWSVAPSMSEVLIEKVVSYYHQNKSQYVSQVILGNYHGKNFDNLKNTVKSWESNALFSSRMHILQPALRAHCAGDYALSVPVLYSQIEGILNEYVKDNELDVKLGRIQKVYKAAIGDVDEYPIPLWSLADTLLYQLENNIFSYEDFEKEFNKTSHNRKITRHTVLHGVSVNYDKPSISLKAFILLDALSALQYAKTDE
jgi:hypothetical protein